MGLRQPRPGLHLDERARRLVSGAVHHEAADHDASRCPNQHHTDLPALPADEFVAALHPHGEWSDQHSASAVPDAEDRPATQPPPSDDAPPDHQEGQTQ